MSTDTTSEPTQQRLDRVSYDMYVDCGQDPLTAARNLGCTPATVKARVRRHALRLARLPRTA